MRVRKGILFIFISIMAVAQFFGAGPAPAFSKRVVYKPVVCQMPKAPHINIIPRTADVFYDYSLNSRQLAMKKSNTVNPYAPGTDTTTGGLREDQPVEKIEISWGYATYTPQNVVCLWYDTINITIDLKPHIYLANDGLFATDLCREAITDHELKHVKVDRYVMNEHARRLGVVLQSAVNEGGLVGPFPLDQLKDMENSMANPINKLVESLVGQRREEMSRLQGQVDSLEEYQRVSKICGDARKAAGR
jgi:hypothetical protein